MEELVLIVEVVELLVVVVVPEPPSWGVTLGAEEREYCPEFATLSTLEITPGEKARRAASVVSSSLPRTLDVKSVYCLAIPPSDCWSPQIVLATSLRVIPAGMEGVPSISAASRKTPRYIPLAGAGPTMTEPSGFIVMVLATH